MPSDPFEEYRQVLKATAPDKIDALSPSELRQHYNFLCSHAQNTQNFGPNTHQPWLRRIEEVRDAMQANRHIQTMRLGGKTLFWAKVGGIAAAVGTLVLLSQDLPISRLH